MTKTENQDPFNEPQLVSYPPKFQPRGGKEPAHRVLYRTLLSLALYFGAGYVLLRRIELLVVIVLLILIHEMGHFLAMKYYGYADVSLFFIPFFGAYVSGKKREISQKQSAIIILAGPLPGILIGMALLLTDHQTGALFWGSMSVGFTGLLFILLNVGNLLPLYPLDGGQLLNRVFLDEEGWLSNLFMVASTLFVIWAAVYTKIYLLLLLPALLLYRFYANRKYLILEKKITEAGINLDISYEDLPDKDYWEIRRIIIGHSPSFSTISPGPPYEYDAREEKIMSEVENLLQRNLIQDISLSEKLIVGFAWLAALVVPLLYLKELALLNTFFR